MAGEWNKMKDKMGASSGGPNPDDWQAMRAKIDAHPALEPKAGKSLWLGWILAATLGLLIGLGSWYLGSPEGQNPLKNGQPPISNGELSGEATPESPTDERSLNEKAKRQLPDETAKDQAADIASVEEDKAMVLSPGISSAEASSFSENSSPEVEKANRSSSDLVEEAKPQDRDDLREVTGLAQSQDQRETMITAEEQNDDRSVELNQDVKAKSDEQLVPSDNRTDESLIKEAPKSVGDKELERAKTVVTADSTGEFTEDESLALAEDEDFLDPKTGFKLNEATTFMGLMHEFRDNSPMIYGGGIEFQWNRNRQFFSAGLGYYRIEQNYEQSFSNNFTQIDSSWKLDIVDSEVLDVSRVWVIDSFQAGHYEYDTTRRIVSDSTYVLQIDTNQSSGNIVSVVERPYYFAELPLLYGYTFGTNQWQFRMAAGFSLQQALAYTNDEGGSKSLFGLIALMQPQLNWRVNSRWSIMARCQMRYPIKQEFVLYEQKKLRYSFQMGVSYHW